MGRNSEVERKGEGVQGMTTTTRGQNNSNGIMIVLGTQVLRARDERSVGSAKMQQQNCWRVMRYW
jgi:hypothetical protein